MSSITRLPALPQLSISSSIAQRRAYNNEASSDDGPGKFFNRGSHRGSNGQPLAPTETLYVGNLQFDVKEDELRDHFAEAGEISNVKIIHDIKGLSKG